MSKTPICYYETSNRKCSASVCHANLLCGAKDKHGNPKYIVEDNKEVKANDKKSKNNRNI